MLNFCQKRFLYILRLAGVVVRCSVRHCSSFSGDIETVVVNLGLYRANITNIQFTNHRAGISDISGASPRPFSPFSGQVRWELLQYHQGGGLK